VKKIEKITPFLNFIVYLQILKRINENKNGTISEKNPNPVLCVEKDGTVLYSNSVCPATSVSNLFF
jgi:hypothetical protein